MRIIDKNTDFYDYLQGIYRDSSITFDRTDSYVLTKEMVCSRVEDLYKRWQFSESHILLQVCNTFWLISFDVTKKDSYGEPKDYEASLVATWKNYNKSRALIKLDYICLGWRSVRVSEKNSDANVLVQAVDTNDYRSIASFNNGRVCTGDRKWEDRHIPILKASGLAKCIDPLEIYLSFEEYFSLEKAASERTESVGITDKERIENHGFDIKKSFRGR